MNPSLVGDNELNTIGILTRDFDNDDLIIVSLSLL